MRIWIDLGNSPHVPFFNALAKDFGSRGHEIVWTARDYAQTVALARSANLDIEVFGTHGGKNIFVKSAKFAARILDLAGWSRHRKIDMLVSHNSLEPLAVARLFGIKSVNLMDYEHHPNNHLSFRLANKVIVPDSFPAEQLKKYGAYPRKVRRFAGIKEDVYLGTFKADPAFMDELESRFDIGPANILIVVRPHAPDALYNRRFENELLDHSLDRFAAAENTRIVVLPRKLSQADELRARHPQPNVFVVNEALDGANLIASADLVVSGGGTMNREAAAMGVPTATIFTGKPAAVDEYLCSEGRMTWMRSAEDIDAVVLRKKGVPRSRERTGVRKLVADLILE